MELFTYDFKSAHIVMIVGQIIFIAALIQMVYQRRSPISMIAWLLGFFLIPYVTVPFYFLIGLRKQRYTKADLFVQNGGSLPAEYLLPERIEGNRFEFYTNATESFETLMEHAKAAKESIYIEVYKLDIDETTQIFLEMLGEKAREGVKVNILIDALGSIGLYLFQRRLEMIRSSGVEVAFFMPIVTMPFRNYINLRNHRKAFIFDAVTVIAGGMNLTNTYLGTSSKKRWEDILFLIQGAAALAYVKVFTADWEYATGKKIQRDERRPEAFGDVTVEVIPSGPDVKADTLYETLLKKIYEAKKRIWIVTPYFTPDESIYQALVIAQHHGVDVRLITPRESDHLIADLSRSSFMREIEERGIYVALFDGSMLHAKAMIIDDIAVLGSANISYRSMFLNYEMMSFFYSDAVVEKVEAWMERLLASSTRELRKSGKMRRLGENLMKVFSPVL